MNTRNQKSTQLRAIGYTTDSAVRELKRLVVTWGVATRHEDELWAV